MQYNYYHGGKYQFIEWGGHNFSGTGADITPPDVGAFFYNDTSVVESFKRYITQHLNVSSSYVLDTCGGLVLIKTSIACQPVYQRGAEG